MTDSAAKPRLKDFPANYWLVIIFEFFERGAYYGMMSILSVYLTGQLGFSKEGVGVIKSTIQPLLYFLPIFTGAIADRVGYRRMLMVAFALLGLGYFLTSQTTEYAAVFAALVVMGLGAGTFKPIISGSIARVTDERTSTLGFGIFYWTINLGAFLFPLIIVPYLKAIAWQYVIIASAVCTGAMLIPTFLVFRDPVAPAKTRDPLGVVFRDVAGKLWMVLRDWRFILFIFIYSWFWILYFQMFDSVLWYVQAFVDAAPLDAFVQGVTGLKEWHFDVEHVTVINAGTIILLQLVISRIVARTKALPTMVVGVSIATAGMALLAVSSSIWVFMAGIMLFSIGEMTTHPKYISYLGLIAPQDRKATYMGFGFLYGAFGSLIGGVLGAFLYVRFVDNPMIGFVRNALAERGQPALPGDVKIAEALDAAARAGLTPADISVAAHTQELWLLFSGIGVLCVIGLLLYQRFIGARANA